MTEKFAQIIIGLLISLYFLIVTIGIVVMEKNLNYYKQAYQQCVIRQMPPSLIKNLDIGK